MVKGERSESRVTRAQRVPLRTGPETQQFQIGGGRAPNHAGRKLIMSGATVRGPVAPVAYDVGEAAVALRLSRSGYTSSSVRASCDQ